MEPHYDLRASDSQILLWNSTENIEFLNYLWYKVFTTDQRVSIWNCLEIPYTYLDSIKRLDDQNSDQDFENQNIENEDRQYSQTDIRRITESNEHFMLFVCQVFVCVDAKHSLVIGFSEINFEESQS